MAFVHFERFYSKLLNSSSVFSRLHVYLTLGFIQISTALYYRYKVMTRCWPLAPDIRPTAAELHRYLVDFHDKLIDYV